MKMKQIILLAMSAVFSVFGAKYAMAASALDTIRIQSITKSVEGGAAVTSPLSPGATVYFDVRLVDTNATPVEFIGNNISFGETYDRPYLVLNIPLQGESTKNTLTGRPAGEAASAVTPNAVAYYKGQGDKKDILRFAYDVRPGDVTETLTWAKAASGAPLFGGEIDAIRVTLEGSPQQISLNLNEGVLQGATTASVPEDAEEWAVGGYNFKIGALTAAADRNKGKLYQGLVPVTVSTKDNAAATRYSADLASECFFWVEAWDEANSAWKWANVGVTWLDVESAAITEAKYTDPLFSDTFMDSIYAGFTAPSQDDGSTTEPFASQTFFVNVPASIPAGTKVRLCYGVRNDGEVKTLYTYHETTVIASPVAANADTNGYEILCGEMDEEDFTLPDSGLRAAHADLLGAAVSGGVINIAAGETSALTISKNNIDLLRNSGTLYADIELLSSTNEAKGSFSRYYVPLDPNDTTGGATVNLSILPNSKGGTTYYRIRVPQLEETDATAKDKPFYLKVVASQKRESITITRGATGNMGTEFYDYEANLTDTEAGSSISLLEYTLTVPVSTQNRHFLIFPVAYDTTTRIPSTAVFADGRNVHEALARYAKLQSQGGSIMPNASLELRVSVPAGETSATFYAACLNEFPLPYLNGDIYLNGDVTDASSKTAINGVYFVAKSCNTSGVITGTNDICTGMAAPNVQNRAPSIISSNPPTSGATGTSLPFTFNVVDTYTDYLMVQMDFGDGEVRKFLYASDAEMIAIMGEAAWEAKLTELAQIYGGKPEDYKTGGERRKERSTLGNELITFAKTYTSASAPTWNFSVSDPTGTAVTRSGTLTLQTSQVFTFSTVTNATVPATGYVRWGNQKTTPGDVDFDWDFGETYTYNGLPKSGGTIAMVQAMPFFAGAETPEGYTQVSATRDSFFYKWAASYPDYEALLPIGEKRYDRTLSISRAFVAGGGEADDPAKWQDIMLDAIFVAEWLPSDAMAESFPQNSFEPHLYELGDYNQDGLPDGWLIRTLGAEAGRAAAEGANIAGNAPEGDTLPAAGWANGDAAFCWQPVGTRLGYNEIIGPGPFAAGSAFTNQMRLRGRDRNLNAANGEGNWLSIPAWAVIVHPERADGVVCAGNLAGAEFEPAWRRIELYDGMFAVNADCKLERTAMGIPYDANQIVDGWAPVIDAGGNPIDATAPYTANIVKVQTDDTKPDYETFRYSYARWGYELEGEWDDSTLSDEGAVFPFTAAGLTDPGAEFQGTYYFSDSSLPIGGLLLDEPFSGTDPLRFSWLSRFPPNNADVDGDGVSNGMEYYFWYYASRMAWAPTVKDKDGHVQILKDAWPMIDPAKIHPENWNSDETLGTTEVFVMGRKYRNGYQPDAPKNSFYDQDNGGPGRATGGKGNYWEPITVAEVLNHFNPYVASAGGDLDNDGLGTEEEIANGTNPIDCDTDDDWIPDGWEVAFGLDPLNLGDNTNDAEENPDQDYYAVVEVQKYADYHHLFRVTGLEDKTGADLITMNPALNYYFNSDNDAIYSVPSTVDPSIFNEANVSYVGPAADYKIQEWADEEAVFMKMNPVTVRIRDNAVYKAFGFNHFTGWSGRFNTHGIGKFKDLKSVNTQAFVSREEFNTAVLLNAGATLKVIKDNSTSPISADTDGDGAPDGWEAYVGLSPYGVDTETDTDQDGLSGAAEFRCRGANLASMEYAWPASLQDAQYDTAWVNKIYPTDPNNPDTDFDGISDGDEGASTGKHAYIYGTPGDSSWLGGGLCPTSMDTDGDGMSDGWEYLHGIPSHLATAGATPGLAVDDEDELVLLRGAPDPTANDAAYHDTDLDYDRDGLTNYQEYLVGLMRHLRYDLGPDAARLYKDIPGELTEDATVDAGYVWTEIPEIYSALEDLANPVTARSVDYVDIEGVPVLAQAWASCGAGRAGQYNQAMTIAFNRLWNTTIAFPTAEQIEGYGLNPIPVIGEGETPEAFQERQLIAQQVTDLAEAFVEFDAAYQRLSALDAAGNPLLVSASPDAEVRIVAERQVRALFARIDLLIAALETDEAQAQLQPVICDILPETKRIWTVRKMQVADFLSNGDLGLNVDQAYNKVQKLATDAGLTYTKVDPNSFASIGANYGADGDYEAAVYITTSPLLRNTYRAAVRGYTGGIWEKKYLGALGQHAPVAPFATKLEGGVPSGGRSEVENCAIILGASISNQLALGVPVAMPMHKLDEGKRLTYPTSSPLLADSDMDGMDDYWEVFHGLNPILGDYANASSSAGSADGYLLDTIFNGYLSTGGEEGAVLKGLSPTGSNPFAAPALETGVVTGFDYYTYPWLAGVPFADPDGDGLLNFEEAPNPTASEPAHYGTDPSALWMTDKANRNAFTTRFYGCVNANLMADMIEVDANGNEKGTISVAALLGDEPIYPVEDFPYISFGSEVRPELTEGGFVLPFEINEGYDTDGDGIGDLTELTSTTIYRGDPQSLRTPDRQQAAYFGGEGALQSFGETQFGPTALTTFTLECWVKPDADQTADTVVLIDRPWRFNEGAEELGHLRHNFTLGLKKSGADFLPYVTYTGAGTVYSGLDSAPEAAPEVVSGETIKAGEWNHIAATYDGKRLVIILNGTETGAAASTLIPANGVISLKNDGLDELQRFTYRNAPILIGAAPASGWFSMLGNPNVETPFADYYTGCYTGFIDEVRIWNGARTASQIAETRRTGFTQAQLLDFRYKAFMARYEGQGYYQNNTPAEPLAIYTFNDLLAGALNPEDNSDPNNPKPAAPAEEPWERYPGQQLVGDDDVSGSFTYRRKGFTKNKTAAPEGNAFITTAVLPEVTDLFTSYYTLSAAKNLRSTFYCENSEAVAAGTHSPITEYVPLAHNTITHLPVADVERDTDEEELVDCLLKSTVMDDGSPDLRFPSGSAENLKVLDSVYWSPYAAGYKVATEKTYNVKTSGNPYAYYYGATHTFDMANYRVYPGYTFRSGTDLLIYGDVFAKYDFESWDNSPSTDPSAGSDPTSTVEEGPEWFEYADGGTDFDDIQNSQGGQWLEDNVAIGQTKDTDGDRMPNWWENYYGLDPEDPTGVNGPHGDVDGDFLTNYAEYLAKSNPGKYSTVGNGVPDSQIPIWFRRGRPTFGLLYTDNDLMEDHWEAANRTDRLTVDLNDAAGDADGDGWSNFAEARTGFRSSKHSTNPNAATSIAQTGLTVLEMPTPAIRLTVDYFGDQNVYTNATDAAKIVVHAYTATNNNSAPDAVFELPLATVTSAEEAQEYSQDIGDWARGFFSGYLHIGNIVPGSLRIRYARHIVEGSEEVDENDFLYFDILADTALENNEAKLYYNRQVTATGEDGITTETMIVRVPAGKINYTTGYYELDFTDENLWPSLWKYTSDDGVISYYDATENTGTVTYKSGVVAGKSNTFTLVKPDSGYLKEGVNNFFVFADLNGSGTWEDGEPAGIPDQHDVEIGFDLVNKPLHVALTEHAPPGAVRLDVKSILEQVLTVRAVEDTSDSDSSASLSAASDSSEDSESGELLSTVKNPTTGDYLKISDFTSSPYYELVLVEHSTIATGGVENVNPPAEVYRKQYNPKKPYLTEDEIFSDNPMGFPGIATDGVTAATYKVYYIPTTHSDTGIESWENYNIAIVTNRLDQLDDASTQLVSPVGGAYRYNNELAFEWLCNVQVPTFTLTITKTADGSGTPTNKVVHSETIRGVTPIATAKGTGSVEQFRYRYMLPRGIGELGADDSTVFGNGTYSYQLTLNPYNGKQKTLSSSFKLQLTDSNDVDMVEVPGAEQDTSNNAQDAYYLRARVRYNGILARNESFGARPVMIEAHYSASFNGDPVASTSDKLVYDEIDETTGTFDPDGEACNLNRCVRMVKDKVYGDDLFFSTRFDAEIRGLPTAAPVYLMAYFDLNGNGKRDAWEPWGYAMQGLDATNGFYYDPRAVKPVSSGKDYQIEFYIQDVDTDNDKLADSWEWLSSGKPTTDFLKWCNKYGTSIEHYRGTSIWVPNATNGGASLTAYGAQLFGLTATGEADENGAVQVEDFPEDALIAQELVSLIGMDETLALFEDGYLTYGLTVSSISCDGEAVTIKWDPLAISVTNGGMYNLSELLAKNMYAVYAVYGKASISDTEWTKLTTINVAGVLTPEVTIPLSRTAIQVGDEEVPAAFFKIILSAKQADAAATLAD